MVAERSVNLRRYILIYIWNIRIENVDMSSDKQCEKHCHLMFKVSKVKLIFLIFRIGP